VGKADVLAGCQGLLRGRPTILGIVHDDPEVTPLEKIRYDACLVVDGVLRAEGEIGVQEIGGGEFAVTTHRGPYDRLSTLTRAFLAIGCLRAVANRDRLRVSRSTGTLPPIPLPRTW